MCLAILVLGGGVARGQYTGSVVGWGQQVVVELSALEGLVAVAGGYSHGLGVKCNGMIVAWGRNSEGQCNVPSPNADFVAVAGGGQHSLGIKSGGTIVVWGRNNEGQCSIPSPNDDFVAVAGGSSHSLGVKSNGTVVAWGDNRYGQCNVPSPNERFVAVAGGYWNSLGLRRSPQTAVEELKPGDVPGAAVLQILSAAPNPFTASMEISFETRQPGPVVMQVYDVSGRDVTGVSLGSLEAGVHWARWDGRDGAGAAVPSGVYFVRLRGAAGQSRAVKALLIR